MVADRIEGVGAKLFLQQGPNDELYTLFGFPSSKRRLGAFEQAAGHFPGKLGAKPTQIFVEFTAQPSSSFLGVGEFIGIPGNTLFRVSFGKSIQLQKARPQGALFGLPSTSLNGDRDSHARDQLSGLHTDLVFDPTGSLLSRRQFSNPLFEPTHLGRTTVEASLQYSRSNRRTASYQNVRIKGQQSKRGVVSDKREVHEANR